MIAEDSVRFAHSGPSQRFLRGLRPLVSVGPLPLPVSAGGHASAITTILPLEIRYKNIAVMDKILKKMDEKGSRVKPCDCRPLG